MLWLGLRDDQEQFTKLNDEKDAEFDKNNFIEYHVFMKKVIECIPDNANIDPSEVLHKIFFDNHTDNVDLDDFMKPDPKDLHNFDRYERPEKAKGKQISKKSLNDPYSSNVRDSGDVLQNPVKASSKTPKNFGEPSTMQRSPNKQNAPSNKKVGGVNGGAGGDFYIGLDEACQGDIELYFRSHFTGLIER